MNGRPFASDLEASLEREVRIENDANCFALSEARGGAGRGHPTVFGVIIGTGTGGGLVIDGKLVNGPHAISGEWGHNPLPWQRSIDGSPSCYCGKSACIETFLSGPGLEHNYRLRFGESRSSHEIIAGASAGDDACEAMMALYHDQMARSLAQLINILDPHAICRISIRFTKKFRNCCPPTFFQILSRLRCWRRHAETPAEFTARPCCGNNRSLVRGHSAMTLNLTPGKRK
jgi:predicted NBD/HSP70 family sugar kinase